MPGEVYALEQNLALGPLETPLRCVVVKLKDGTCWVHAPVAPTREFFELAEEIGKVAHVVVPTYALEHKIFAKAALERWPSAKLWVAPGQFSFPVDVPLAAVFGREPDGVLGVLGGRERRRARPARWDSARRKTRRARRGWTRSRATCYVAAASRSRGRT